MPLFLLTPTKRYASDTAHASTIESVQVEAATEERARRRAHLFVPGTPWDQRHLVTARVIEAPDLAVRLILAGDAP